MLGLRERAHNREQRVATLEDEIAELSPTVVDDEYGGRVFDPKHRNSLDGYYILDQFRVIMDQVGVIYNPDSGIIQMPDTERLSAICEANEIPIILEEDARGEGGRIPEHTYARDVNGGAHPVGTNSVDYYEHDVKSIDHMPAVALLRDDLFDSFSKGTDYNGGVANAYDCFTSDITIVLRNLFNSEYEEVQMALYVCSEQIFGFGESNSEDEIKRAFVAELVESINRNLERLGIEDRIPIVD